MRFIIWGAGAIGGTVGAYLHRGGHDVTLVDIDRAHVERIREAGVTLNGAVDVNEMVPATYADEVTETYSVGLLCVKSQHTAEATRALAPHLGADGYIVSLQNGFNPREIASIVGEERTVGAFINNFHADYLEPGVIRYGGHGRIVLGELSNRVTPRVERLSQAFSDFGAIATDNIWGYLWAKEAYSAMLCATALSNDTMSDALVNPKYQDLYIALGNEVLALAMRIGITPETFPGFDTTAFMPGNDPATGRAALDAASAFIRPSPKKYSGVWRDLAVRKRRTEVDAQLGPIVRSGAELGIPFPVTSRLIALIHDVEEGRRVQGVAALDALNEVLASQ